MPQLSRPFVYSMLACFLGILWLSCSCTVVSDTTEARRSEGAQLLKSARDALREAREKTKQQSTKLSELGVLSAYDGEYFSVLDGVYEDQWPAQADGPMFRDKPTAIVAAPKNPADGWGVLYFDWTTGRSIVEWFDHEPSFLNHPE
jgi:hypothetical protein